MAIAADAPKDGFRLSQLIYDTRYRSYTIQVIVLILFGLGIAWLTQNVISNLALKGKTFDFGFLWSRAGYDIEQTLVPYTNDDNHFRAWMVGLANTLAVAIPGCLLATVLGVFVGVLRLSKNWLVARLMTVYVEIFRNIPLLLWILIVYVPMRELTSEPKDFRVTPDMETNRALVTAAKEALEPTSGPFARLWDISFISGPFLLWALAIVVVFAVVAVVSRRVRAATTTALSLWGAAAAIAVLSLYLFAPLMQNPLMVLRQGDAGFVNTASFTATELEALGVNGPVNPDAAMWFHDSLALSTRGINAPLPLFERPLGSFDLLGLPVNLTFLATLIVIIGSFFVNRMVVHRARAVQEATGVRPVTWWKSILILAGPFLALMYALGFHLEYPVLGRFNFSGGVLLQHAYSALLIALVLYTGAFIAEIVRSGILAINRGQSEAAFALGLRPGRTMNLVVLPQALRVIIPPLISQYLNLTKNTSLAIAVSYLDLRGTLGGITLNQTGRELECMLLMMANYLVLSLLISSIANIYNRSIQLKER